MPHCARIVRGFTGYRLAKCGLCGASAAAADAVGCSVSHQARAVRVTARRGLATTGGRFRTMAGACFANATAPAAAATAAAAPGTTAPRPESAVRSSSSSALRAKSGGGHDPAGVLPRPPWPSAPRRAAWRIPADSPDGSVQSVQVSVRSESVFKFPFSRANFQSRVRLQVSVQSESVFERANGSDVMWHSARARGRDPPRRQDSEPCGPCTLLHHRRDAAG